jgi:hypothetical protein
LISAIKLRRPALLGRSSATRRRAGLEAAAALQHLAGRAPRFALGHAFADDERRGRVERDGIRRGVRFALQDAAQRAGVVGGLAAVDGSLRARREAEALRRNRALAELALVQLGDAGLGEGAHLVEAVDAAHDPRPLHPQLLKRFGQQLA